MPVQFQNVETGAPAAERLLPVHLQSEVSDWEPERRSPEVGGAPRHDSGAHPKGSRLTDEPKAVAVLRSSDGSIAPGNDVPALLRRPNPKLLYAQPAAEAPLSARRDVAVAASARVPADLTEPAAPITERSRLRQAMAAATTSESSGRSNFTQPVVRVDPGEKNLDRAMARAFAWAFAVDRSFFSEPPTGKARFVVELRDDGRIAGLRWLAPEAPDRLKELLQRMTRLLSVNRFELPQGDAIAKRRSFAVVVTESRVRVPTEAAAVDGQVGDIWMLGAGDTPTIGHPSHPVVADVTGHQFSGELRILEPLSPAE